MLNSRLSSFLKRLIEGRPEDQAGNRIDQAHNSADFLHDRVIAHYPRTNADLRGVIDSDGTAQPYDERE